MKRVFVEKKKNLNVENVLLAEQISIWLNKPIHANDVRIINIYDVVNVDDLTFSLACKSVFSEPNVDEVYFDIKLPGNKAYLAIKKLSAQFDVRANSAEQCIRILNPKCNPKIWTSRLYVFESIVDKFDLKTIRKMMINPIESEEKDLNTFGDEIPNSSNTGAEPVPLISAKKNKIEELSIDYNLQIKDLLFIKKHFTKIKRNPTITEMRFLSAYWSDHCRHTTFNTKLTHINIEKQPLFKKIESSLSEFKKLHKKYRKGSPFTLMKLSSIVEKWLIKSEIILDIEKSDEVNACGFFANIIVDGNAEKWLVEFKNETHNHPTEIEPFGGASTCIGGAIRDPLSSRTYVYQGVRISGAGNPFEQIIDTMDNKLPQSFLSKESARGFSSYGNQIGIATSLVKEYVHPGYRAKRLECGAVVGVAPYSIIKRQKLLAGDLILLVGGRTGKDGIGGAVGSSFSQNSDSIKKSIAEVQKGNPIEERKLQRIFRNNKFSTVIKKCNDLGAGGIAVAIGEMADSITINLDKVPLKYQGLNATEIALSESQERMAIAITPMNLKTVQALCQDENLEVVSIAEVTKTDSLIIKENGKTIVELDRKFLNSNGAPRKVKVTIPYQNDISNDETSTKSLKEKFANCLSNPNIASQKGLQQMFDSTIGGLTVLAPYGGKYQLSPTQVSIQKFPVGNRFTNNATMMSFGFDPDLTSESQYLGGMFSVIEALAKIVAAGGNLETTKLSFQEYFEKLDNNPQKWGKVLAALLGACEVMKFFEIPALGGKDSMSGTYNKINVPPTLITFAVSVVDSSNTISTDFKQANNYIYLYTYSSDKNNIPNLIDIVSNFRDIKNLIENKIIESAYAIGQGGIAEALAKMSFGNDLGFDINTNMDLFKPMYGAILFETNRKLENVDFLGVVSEKWIINSNEINKEEMLNHWIRPYAQLFPTEYEYQGPTSLLPSIVSPKLIKYQYYKKVEKPIVLIPIFPGTNCEFDIRKRFTEAGAICKQIIFTTITEKNIEFSIMQLAKELKTANILAIVGGFSASDEPDGSGKFIVNVLKNPRISAELKIFSQKGNLILGVCNGFQALIKSGLLPGGTIRDLSAKDPTLFKNDSNMHVAKYVKTKTTSISSPWLSGFELNSIHTVPISHGEGKFIVNSDEYLKLTQNGQIAFQYVDENGEIALNGAHNPNGSFYGIEGIISLDGLILGKMAHSERYEENIAKNIVGNKKQDIFKNAINYFRNSNRN